MLFFSEHTSKDLKVVILVTIFLILVFVTIISFLIIIMCKLRKTEDGEHFIVIYYIL